MCPQNCQFNLCLNQVSFLQSLNNYCSDRSRFNVYPEDNEKVFECDFVYVMLMSMSACKIHFLVDFPNEEDKRRRRRENKEIVEEKIEAKFSKFFKISQKKPKDNFIEDNIRKITYWNRINEESRYEK